MMCSMGCQPRQCIPLEKLDQPFAQRNFAAPNDKVDQAVFIVDRQVADDRGFGDGTWFQRYVKLGSPKGISR